MITLNHVLVPHDFGDTSKTAMDYAIALARMFNAVLDVLHVRDKAEAASHADFIVMGTHGRQWMERLLTGSIAEHVVRTAACPVLTVRHPEREFIVDDDAAAAMGRFDRQF